MKTSTNTRTHSRFRAFLSAGLLLVTLLSSQAAPLQMIDLGTLDGHDSHADFVNNSGLVVGTSGPFAFAWDTTHGMTSIDGVNADRHYFTGLSDSGYATGYYISNDGSFGGFVWSRTTGTLLIPDFGEGLFPAGINESGQVVGYVNKLGAAYPFIWDRVHGIEIIDLHGEALGINAAGKVTIWAYDGAGYVWDRTHGLTGLGSINGSAVYPSFINDAGEVASQVWMNDGSIKLAIWNSTNGWVEIATIPAGMMMNTYLRSFNNNGQLIGNATYMFEDSFAFVVSRTSALQKIGLAGRYSAAASQNAAGTVSGVSVTIEGQYVGFVWDAVRGTRSLGTLGGLDSYGASINSRGQIVGDSSTSPETRNAFLWDESTGIQDLGRLGGTYSSASQISDAGIIGYAETPTGYHAFFIALPNNSAPDLQISAVSAVNNQAPQGSKVTIFATVKNSGSGSAAATTTLITANGATLGSIATPAIPAGQSVTVSVDWRTAAQNGDYTLTARADSANVVAESSETNNTKSIAVTLKGNKIR